jgi:hypothetical protein
MTDAYFETKDGVWFTPTDFARGPWNPEACHGGPPTALLARALEGIVAHQRLVRVNVELMRPVPMSGFRVQAEIRKPGRSVTLTEAEILDDDRIYVRAFGMHIRRLEHLECNTPSIDSPDFAVAVPGSFSVAAARHGLQSFSSSLDIRFDPVQGTENGGPTTMWMRTKVPILADEEPSPVQRICPLADCGNGISYNGSLASMDFINPDLNLSLHREPVGEWFCSKAVSFWQADGTGLADAELFDIEGPVGRAVQNLLLNPV